MTYYKTHDNGGRPFKVHIKDNNEVEIFKLNQEETKKQNYKTDIYFDVPELQYQPLKVFIGKSPQIPMTTFSGGYGLKFDGNSILLDMGSSNYIYIGSRILKFRSKSPITKFVSPVGNSDVPYPYAVDEQNRFYLLIENVILENVPAEHQEDPYQYYYSESLISGDTRRKPPPEPKQNFKNIVDYCVGTQNYRLTYCPNAGKDYDRIAQWDDFGTGMKLILKDKTEKNMNRNDYIQLMKEFGELKRFEYLPNQILIGRMW